MPEISQQEQFRLKFSQLQQKLTAYDPNMGALITEIHKQIITIPELCYVLTEQEIGQFVEANKRQMKIEIAAKPESGAKQVKKLIEDMSDEDF